MCQGGTAKYRGKEIRSPFAFVDTARTICLETLHISNSKCWTTVKRYKYQVNVAAVIPHVVYPQRAA